ncbi:hypothetical protein CPAR01_04553 [Colletotrichum paranaense]|uniref:Stress response RCI peptide n=1 Tax=Colletotrichum paranaense TaxID=1914294 RepID=A0ABQ9SX38_9PEZI|nr:uncharacterized protein CPAR01_04553 [Colletotrichum paranaense]KAK1543920.1 hypothetical protein CPAR01_04553 [Colletotrichum paranaense]
MTLRSNRKSPAKSARSRDPPRCGDAPQEPKPHLRSPGCLRLGRMFFRSSQSFGRLTSGLTSTITQVPHASPVIPAPPPLRPVTPRDRNLERREAQTSPYLHPFSHPPVTSAQEHLLAKASTLDYYKHHHRRDPQVSFQSPLHLTHVTIPASHLAEMCSADIFLGLLALLFPPLPVWVKRGICGADSIINILLCLLGYIPGLIHAWYIIAKFPEPDYEYESVPQQDREGGRVTYVFVHGNGPNGNGPHTQQPRQQPRPSQHGGKGNGAVGYGTTNNSSNNNNNAGGSSRQQQQQFSAQQQGGAGEGSSDGAVPPSYAEVVAGDNKIQTRD